MKYNQRDPGWAIQVLRGSVFAIEVNIQFKRFSFLESIVKLFIAYKW